MRRLCLSLVLGAVLSGVTYAQACNVPGPYVQYYGNPLLPKINVLSGDFTMGQNTVLRFESGLSFIEGYVCWVVQEHTDNLSFVYQIPGIAGDLYICPDRPFTVFHEGQLLGGLNAGNSPPRTINVPFNPALCGFALGSQAYVTTEILTNPTFSQYTVGVFH